MLVAVTIYTFAFGAIIGSFLNVVIHRYPREESVVFPPSRCPHCAKIIRPYDNIPVLSYLLLLGRCRACRAPISPRYPLVELANGLFYVAVVQRTGVTWAFVPIAALISMTIALIYIDLEIQILPSVINFPGVAIGLIVGATHLGALYPDLLLARTITDSLAGAVAGAGVILALRVGYQLFRKKEGMGLGDVKMMAMLGAVLGLEPLLPLLLLASMSGALVGVPIAIKSRHGMQVALPFGVFLGLAFLVTIFFGNTLSDAWFGMFTPE